MKSTDFHFTCCPLVYSTIMAGQGFILFFSSTLGSNMTHISGIFTYSQNSTTGSTGVMVLATKGSSSQDVTLDTTPSRLTTLVVVQLAS